jgi:DNA replicative helicase MCM subunit Mcm2 (Cdc46/Mcm family)
MLVDGFDWEGLMIDLVNIMGVFFVLLLVMKVKGKVVRSIIDRSECLRKMDNRQQDAEDFKTLNDCCGHTNKQKQMVTLLNQQNPHYLQGL